MFAGGGGLAELTSRLINSITICNTGEQGRGEREWRELALKIAGVTLFSYNTINSTGEG
jgi:hypothetical protein